jgi:hypothetical protein
MKRLLLAAAFILAMTRPSRAQGQFAPSALADRNVAADFADTSAASVASPRPACCLIAVREPLPAANFNFSAVSQPSDLAAASAALPWPSLPVPSSAAMAPEPSPVPQREPTFVDEGYRLELSLNVAVVRFRSSVFSATAIGINTSLAYYLKEWLAVEGNVVPAFAPTIYQAEHVKYLGYAGGAKVLLSRSKLVPWVHALAGGSHLLPLTGLGGKSSFQIQVGGGVDYALNPRISARIGADYFFTHFFSESQNNFQGYAGLAYHF